MVKTAAPGAIIVTSSDKLATSVIGSALGTRTLVGRTAA